MLLEMSERIGDCSIVENEILLVDLPRMLLSLDSIDSNHIRSLRYRSLNILPSLDDRRILKKDGAIQLGDKFTIGGLQEEIRRKHNIHGELCIYRCPEITRWEDDEGELHHQISEIIKGQKVSGDKQTFKGLKHKAPRGEMISATPLGGKRTIERLEPSIPEETLLVMFVGASLCFPLYHRRLTFLRDATHTCMVPSHWSRE
jgi:hypothetical protein